MIFWRVKTGEALTRHFSEVPVGVFDGFRRPQQELPPGRHLHPCGRRKFSWNYGCGDGSSYGYG